jgi:hypothetical protein
MNVLKYTGFCFSVVFFMVSCTKDNSLTQSMDKTYVDKKGGSFVKGNMTLVFPEDAVNSKTEINLLTQVSTAFFDITDSVCFFRHPVEILPFGLAFNSPVKLILAYDRYWFKIFDKQHNEIKFDPKDLKFYQFPYVLDEDGETDTAIERIDQSDVKYTNDSIIISTSIENSGYYGVGISKKMLKNVIAYFGVEITFSDSSIANWNTYGEGTETRYTFCNINSIAYTNIKAVTAQVIDWIDYEQEMSQYFSFKTTAPPTPGKHTFVWNDSTYNDCSIYDYISEVSIRSKNLTEATITYDKIDGLRKVLQGVLEFEGITLFYQDTYYTKPGDSKNYYIANGYYDVKVKVQININE